jgi:hypothetical protein
MALGVCDYCEVVAVHVTYSSIGMRGDCALRFGLTGAISVRNQCVNAHSSSGGHS